MLQLIFALMMVYYSNNYYVITEKENIAKALYENHEQYLETSIQHRRFKHTDILSIIHNLEKNQLFQVTTLGKSLEGREIFQIKLGRGKTKVLLWSQMHGDEPTATMAILDMFNFFSQNDDLDPIKEQILGNLTIYFIPMLNPDGAEVYQRRNAQELDLNRDALRLESPEAKILKSAQERIKPDFGFNLHDQNTRYTAGKTSNPATISFLAPPYDQKKSVNQVRQNAMQLIVQLNEVLQNFIPGQIGKYSDEFEPRAFGDNFQKWGTSTILVESGGYAGDTEKQYIRKLNFTILLTALAAISEETYKEAETEMYYQIPENELYLYDLIIRNVSFNEGGKSFTGDIGINRAENNDHTYQNYFYSSTIEEIGDMSVFFGYEEFNADGLTVTPGKIYPDPFQNVNALEKINPKELLKQGYTTVIVENLPSDFEYSPFPLNIAGSKNWKEPKVLTTDSPPDFILKKDEKAVYAVVNGFFYDLVQDQDLVKNGMIY
ncbi:hypothetical protein BH23BAC1_BH23BAC1_13840 [soil metagenome]